MGPRLRVLYLVGIAVGVFLVRDARVLGGALVVQLVLWVVLGHPVRQVLRIARRLVSLLFFVALTFVLFPPEGDDRTVALWGLEVSRLGLETGAAMALRIFTVILVSELIRRGTPPSTFVEGLRGLFVPESIAATIDATLHLLGESDTEHGGGRGGGGGGGGGRGRGGGHGGGRGRRMQEGGGASADPGFPLRRILRGDVGFFIERIEDGLDRGQAYIRRASPHLSAERARDLGVVSGITLTMTSLKLLKVLPGLPFAPGHKTVLLLPLYILASRLTVHRWGATLVGTSMGILGFLMGDGRYGVFEVLKHIVPGVLIDLMAPLMAGTSGVAGAFRYGLVGLVAAFGRFSSIVAVTLFMGAPAGFYALVAPLGLVHLGFGAASGAVTFALMRSYDRLQRRLGAGGAEAAAADPDEKPPAPGDGDPSPPPTSS